MQEIKTLITWIIFPPRIKAAAFFLVIYLGVVFIGNYCWSSVFSWRDWLGAALLIYIPLFPAMLSLLCKQPKISYLGIILFCASFFLFNNGSCRNFNSTGGASMVQIPIVFFGFISTSLGVGLSWILFYFSRND